MPIKVLALTVRDKITFNKNVPLIDRSSQEIIVLSLQNLLLPLLEIR